MTTSRPSQSLGVSRHYSSQRLIGRRVPKGDAIRSPHRESSCPTHRRCGGGSEGTGPTCSQSDYHMEQGGNCVQSSVRRQWRRDKFGSRAHHERSTYALVPNPTFSFRAHDVAIQLLSLGPLLRPPSRDHSEC